mgnify:CR=1 FL=1
MTSTARLASQGGLCKATRKDGQACCAYSLLDSDFCFAHDPTKAAARKAARSAGGRARHGRTLKTTSTGDQGVRLGSVADVVELLEGAVADLLALENSVARARAVGYLAGIAVRALEIAELEDRIGRLEDKVGV